MYKKREDYLNFRVKTLLLVLNSLLFVFSLLFVPIAYSGDFKLVKVNSYYEPELRELSITLPSTNIKAGLYRYDTDDGGSTGKIGFLFNKEKFYFLQSNRSDPVEGQYGLSGDVTYGIYKNYFLLEASAGGTTRNSYLFLFKYDKNGVRFLDVITKAVMSNHEIMDFISITMQIGKDGYPSWESGSPVWMVIKDIDNDGRPEIKLLTSVAFKFEGYFHLFLEVRNDRLKVDFNPNLYKPFFEQEKRKSKVKTKGDQYYIYGFLSKELSLTEIKHMLKPDRQSLIGFIENIKNMDEAFHELVMDEKFVLMQYNLKRR